MAEERREGVRGYARGGTRRRGSAYAMVLSVTMLVTVVGLGALATSRVTTRGAGASNDWLECGAIAFSAAEHAMAKLNAEAALAPAGWRAAYTEGATAFAGDFGRGKLVWVLQDGATTVAAGASLGDGVLADDYADPVKLRGIGTLGATRRAYSVTFLPTGEGADVLRTAMHAGGNITLGGPTLVLDGPASANGSLVNGANLLGGVTSEIAGTGGTYAPPKTMPSAGAFDLYRLRATTIAPEAAADGGLAPGALTATTNPYGAANAEGIYYLRLPSSIGKLTIRASRIEATLLIEAAAGTTSQTVEIEGQTSWRPGRANLPTLITKGIRKLTFLGDAAAYSDGSGTYLSEVRGLVHVTGGGDAELMHGAHVRGCLIADGNITASGVVGVTATPGLQANPPMGYTKGNRLAIVPGSWKWDDVPAGQ